MAKAKTKVYEVLKSFRFETGEKDDDGNPVTEMVQQNPRPEVNGRKLVELTDAQAKGALSNKAVKLAPKKLQK